MNVHFLLCDLCLAKYQSLRFDASAILTLSYEPFNCIIWLDEHPTGPPLSSFDGDEYTEENYHDLQEHQDCRSSILRLSSARAGLWFQGKVPDRLNVLWPEAKAKIPEWPGFRRLNLRDYESVELTECLDELGLQL